MNLPNYNAPHDLPAEKTGTFVPLPSNTLRPNRPTHAAVVCEITPQFIFSGFKIQGWNWNRKTLDGGKSGRAGSRLKDELKWGFWLSRWSFIEDGKGGFEASGRYPISGVQEADIACGKEAIRRAGGPNYGCDWGEGNKPWN